MHGLPVKFDKLLEIKIGSAREQGYNACFFCNCDCSSEKPHLFVGLELRKKSVHKEHAFLMNKTCAALNYVPVRVAISE